MVPTAWENEKPTTQGGLLKVPSHSGADQPEGEPGQENSPTKKKKKKKKKTAESGGQSQDGGSAKRTQKPIQFDLGVMLQNISVRILKCWHNFCTPISPFLILYVNDAF